MEGGAAALPSAPSRAGAVRRRRRGGVLGADPRGVEVKTFLGGLEAAALIGVLNAVLPPLVAALRLPLMLIIGFLAVLIVDALILLLVSQLAPNDFKVDSFGGRCWQRW